MHNFKSTSKMAAFAAIVFLTPYATATESLFDSAKKLLNGATDKAPTSAQIEVAFSPYGGSESLVLKVINASSKTIRLSAYSFTSPTVVSALLNAKRRGVEVGVVVDHKHNMTGTSGHARAALSALVNAGIPVRTNATMPIAHSKYILADGLHVQTGSFNYSKNARRNGENVLVVWNNPQLSASYAQDWQRLYDAGKPFKQTY